jgi:hypothetical protein
LAVVGLEGTLRSEAADDLDELLISGALEKSHPLREEVESETSTIRKNPSNSLRPSSAKPTFAFHRWLNKISTRRPWSVTEYPKDCRSCMPVKDDGTLPRRIQRPIQTFQTQLQPDEFRDELHNSGLSWLLGSLKADVAPLQG